MYHLKPYINATPDGEPIFIVQSPSKTFFLKATTIEDYETLRNMSLIHNNQYQDFNVSNNSYIDGNPPLMDTRKYTAYSHLYTFNAFQYTMEKQLLGFAYILDTENKQVLVFDKNSNLEDFLYRYFGYNHKKVNFFAQDKQKELTKILESLYAEGKITPLFTFKNIAYELIKKEIEHSNNNPVNFLHKNTPLSFN